MRTVMPQAIAAALAGSICASVSVVDNASLPYSLSFGPATLTASRFNASGSIETTKLETGPEYQQYYHESLDKLTPGTVHGSSVHDNVVATLRGEVGAMTAMLTRGSAATAEYAAVFVPSIFDGHVQDAAHEAVFPDGSDVYGFINQGPNLKVACEGFGFLECKQIRRRPEECNNDDGLETLILVLEYEEDYLRAGVVEILWEERMFPVNRQKTCVRCGERGSKEKGDKADSQVVEQFLNELIDEVVKKKFGHERSDIWAIVLAGGASPSAFAKLGDIALKAVGTDMARIATGIEPADVMAHGAAAFARKALRYRGVEKPH